VSLNSNAKVENSASVSLLRLDQNYPNPVVQTTTIPFSTNVREHITLILFDELGREVRTLFNSTIDAGEYVAKLNASRLPNGTYLYKLSTPTNSLLKTLIIFR
jgi:hypothetical protein